MAFLPDNQILVTERPGRLLLIEHGRLHTYNKPDYPKLLNEGQGGLLDGILCPDYQNNGWIYFSFSFSAEGEGDIGAKVARAGLEGIKLTNQETIY